MPRRRAVRGRRGPQSPTRAAAGIGVLRWDYDQTGIVATIATRGRITASRSSASSPGPVRDPADDRRALVDRLGRRQPAGARSDRARRCGVHGRAGERVRRSAGRARAGRAALALSARRWSRRDRYTAARLALVGDAARAIHPIAGQGWNLALRDVAALAELVIDARRLGLDPGAGQVLARYERWRRFDSLALIAITDGLNRLFANDLLPLRLARELGLGMVERIAPLKRLLHAPRHGPARRPAARDARRGALTCVSRTRSGHPGDAQQVGRARRAERHAGGDHQARAGLRDACLERVLAGALDHLVDVVRVLAHHAVQAPDQRQPARRGELG